MPVVRTMSGRYISLGEDAPESGHLSGDMAFRMDGSPDGMEGYMPSMGIPALAQDSVTSVTLGREYDGHLCSCGGDLEDPARHTCCFSWLCPCVAFGWNKNRAFGRKRRSILWAVLFGVLLVAPFVAFLSTTKKSCSSPREEHSCRPVVDMDKFKYRVGFTAAISFVLLVTIGAWNRIATRRKFLIQGSGCGFREGNSCEDAMAWIFCSCCALCQETRTLAYNNVRKGVWNGPEALAIDVPPFPAPGVPVQPPNIIHPMEISQRV